MAPDGISPSGKGLFIATNLGSISVCDAPWHQRMDSSKVLKVCVWQPVNHDSRVDLSSPSQTNHNHLQLVLLRPICIWNLSPCVTTPPWKCHAHHLLISSKDEFHPVSGLRKVQHVSNCPSTTTLSCLDSICPHSNEESPIDSIFLREINEVQTLKSLCCPLV